MALIRCDITDGPRTGFKAVAVASVTGRREFFAIEDRFLAKRNAARYLPVRVIGRDRTNQTVLVQLPVEADSGANRVWVGDEDIVEASPHEGLA